MNDEVNELDLSRINVYKDVQEGYICLDEFNQYLHKLTNQAFRAGILYAAKKYENKEDYFTGNDVAMFLEMEVFELWDEEIQQHLQG